MYDKRRFSVKSPQYIQQNVQSRRRQSEYYIEKGVVDMTTPRVRSVGNPYGMATVEESDGDEDSVSVVPYSPAMPSLSSRLHTLEVQSLIPSKAAASAADAHAHTQATLSVDEKADENAQYESSFLYKNRNEGSAPKKKVADQYADVKPRYMLKTSANKSKRMSFYSDAGAGPVAWSAVDSELAKDVPVSLAPQTPQVAQGSAPRALPASPAAQEGGGGAINPRRPSVMLAVMSDDSSRLKAMPTKDLVSATHALELRIAKIAQGLLERGDTSELHYPNPHPSVDAELDANPQPLIKSAHLATLAMQSDKVRVCVCACACVCWATFCYHSLYRTAHNAL